MTTAGEWDPGKDFARHSAAGDPIPKLMSIWRTPKPVIVQVHGWCVGGGSDTALCGDLVIASEDARSARLLADVGRVPVRDVAVPAWADQGQGTR